MLTIEQVRARLTDRNISEVASRIGMNRQQLWMIATGKNSNPTIKTLKRISDYLEGKHLAADGGSQ